MGKRMEAAQKAYDKAKVYTLEEGAQIVKDNAKAKFDETIEIHVKLGIDTKKADQQVRTTVALPHGTGKTKRIAVIAKASRKNGVLPKTDYEKINAILGKYELLREPLFPSEELAKAASHDKKNHSDGINVVTISAIGDCRITKMSLEKFGEYIK